MADTTTDVQWFALIGRVVVTAASLEAAVGMLLFALEQGQTDRFYARPIGQLVKESRRRVRLLDQSSLRTEIEQAIEQTERLMEQRNDVVHGWWRFGIDGQTAIRGRARQQSPALSVHQVTPEQLAELDARLQAQISVVTHLSRRVVAGSSAASESPA